MIKDYNIRALPDHAQHRGTNMGKSRRTAWSTPTCNTRDSENLFVVGAATSRTTAAATHGHRGRPGFRCAKGPSSTPIARHAGVAGPPPARRRERFNPPRSERALPHTGGAARTGPGCRAAWKSLPGRPAPAGACVTLHQPGATGVGRQCLAMTTPHSLRSIHNVKGPPGGGP
jgi:hypothetical protein